MRILNFGSLNIDYTYRVEHIVSPGETLTSRNLEIYPGGKGLNQSIALARAGAEVYHAGMIGADGLFLKELCRESGADVRYLKEVETRTGNAIIQVSDEGQNSILLYAGANRENTKEFVDEVLSEFEQGDLLLLQNEVNLVDYLIEQAYEKNMTVVLNPSPYDAYMEACPLDKVDLFLMNEVEGNQITGKTDPDEILKEMRTLYPAAKVVLTLGEHGSVYSDGNIHCLQDAILTKTVDTTAAGDTFTGYYLAAVLEGMTPEQALLRASYASSIAVSRKGASSSIPYKQEVDAAVSRFSD